MNTKTLYLTSYSGTLTPTVSLSGATSVTFNLSGITLPTIGQGLKIRWGDGTSDYYISRDYFNIGDSLIQTLNKPDATLLSAYSHTYTPSETALTCALSCQIMFLGGGDFAETVVIPITVSQPSYADSLGDLDLISTSMYSVSGDVLYTFISSTGRVVEAIMTGA